MAKKATSTKPTAQAKAPPPAAPVTAASTATSRPAKSAAAPPAAKSRIKAEAKPPQPPAPVKAATVTLKHLAAVIAERHDMPKKQADTRCCRRVRTTGRSPQGG